MRSDIVPFYDSISTIWKGDERVVYGGRPFNRAHRIVAMRVVACTPTVSSHSVRTPDFGFVDNDQCARTCSHTTPMAHHTATALSYAFIVYVTSSDSAEKHDRAASVMPHHVLEWSGQNIYALLLHTRTPRRRTYTALSHMMPCMCWSIAHRASTVRRPTPLILAPRCHQPIAHRPRIPRSQ